MLTIKACERIPGDDRAELFRVVLVDDALPDQEAELILRKGNEWVSVPLLEVDSFTLRVRPQTVDDVERINSTLLKMVPFGRWISAAVAAATDFDRGRDLALWKSPNPASLKPRVRVGAEPDYEAVALLYRILLRTSERGPAEDIAAAFKVPTHQAHQWITRARYMGLLGPISPRKRRRPKWAEEE